MRLHHQTKKAMALILVPFSFLLIGYGLIYELAKPTLRPLYSIYSLIASKYDPSFNDGGSNLYDGKGGNSDGILNLKDVKSPNYGDKYGVVSIESIGLNVDLYYGDSEDILIRGAGQFQGSFMPGFNRTIMVAGHTIPYFKQFGELQVNDEIIITTHYGKFKYKITELKVGKFNDSSLYDLEQKIKEQLILYTCYPLDGIGFKQERFFVYADKVAGPTIRGE